MAHIVQILNLSSLYVLVCERIEGRGLRSAPGDRTSG
jgi:hypothetical protein